MKKKTVESDLLELIEKQPVISQRKISEKTGTSLGTVNFLIKKCIKKGFIKVENLNSRTVKYILTPKGINEKTKKTLNYIKRCYRLIIDINTKLEKFIEKHSKENKKIFLFGENDEVMEIIENILKIKSINYEKKEDLKEIERKQNFIIYLWNIEYEAEVLELGFEYLNIIKMMK